jgi:hypothetical protein
VNVPNVNAPHVFHFQKKILNFQLVKSAVGAPDGATAKRGQKLRVAFFSQFSIKFSTVNSADDVVNRNHFGA